MKAIMLNGDVKELDTNFLSDNQYNTKDGERIFDKDIEFIEDDVRGDVYTAKSMGWTGTYDEIQKRIENERAEINKCEGCFWGHYDKLVPEESSRDTKIVGNRKYIVEHNCYEFSCHYKRDYEDKSGRSCCHDISDKPIKFSEDKYIFFLEYPFGVPDMKDFVNFLWQNRKESGLCYYWDSATKKFGEFLEIRESVRVNKPFGSYVLQTHFNKGRLLLVMWNARNRITFSIDFDNRKFIQEKSFSFIGVNHLKTDIYHDEGLACQDKFEKWLWGWVDKYLEDRKTRTLYWRDLTNYEKTCAKEQYLFIREQEEERGRNEVTPEYPEPIDWNYVRECSFNVTDNGVNVLI